MPTGRAAERRTLVGFTRRADAARLVADLIRSDIVAGQVADPLPQEWELTGRYGASRNELRDALALLQRQGLVRRVPGSGTFALAPGVSLSLQRADDTVWVGPRRDRGGSGEPSDPDSLPTTHRTGYPGATFRCVNARIDAAPQTVAEPLGVDAGDAVLYAELVISHDGEPQRLRSSWVALATAPGIERESFDDYMPNLIGRLRGERTYAARTTFDALNADAEVARMLGVPEHAAILFTERRYLFESGEPAEFGFTRHRGDRTHIVSGWARKA